MEEQHSNITVEPNQSNCSKAELLQNWVLSSQKDFNNYYTNCEVLGNGLKWFKPVMTQTIILVLM